MLVRVQWTVVSDYLKCNLSGMNNIKNTDPITSPIWYTTSVRLLSNRPITNAKLPDTNGTDSRRIRTLDRPIQTWQIHPPNCSQPRQTWGTQCDFAHGWNYNTDKSQGKDYRQFESLGKSDGTNYAKQSLVKLVYNTLGWFECSLNWISQSLDDIPWYDYRLLKIQSGCR